MKEILKTLPASAGVYLFRNSKKQVIYVGKAINLKNRVRSYFQKNVASDKVTLLVENIKTVDYFEVASDLEALLLEAKLIKKYQPFYNSRLKDDKDYLYIIFTGETFPKVITGRKRDIQKALQYFGPFTTANSARATLKLARRIFPFRTSCRPNSGRGCLSYHLGLCPGVCAGVISPQDYLKILKKLERFLNGDTNFLVSKLEKEMKQASKLLRFEEASMIRDKITALSQTTRRFEEVDKYLDGPEALESIYEKQLSDFATKLNLQTLPKRIECYDISNIQGTHSVGSMVVLIEGKVNTDEYRRFKIKSVKGINDPAMMAEVLSRRFKNDWEWPDVIIVDGGRTQLNAATKILSDLNIKIPVFGLAKKQEELYTQFDKRPRRLVKNSPGLLLLQRIRDEAHRFAITFHRKLRSKAFIPNKL